MNEANVEGCESVRERERDWDEARKFIEKLRALAKYLFSFLYGSLFCCDGSITEFKIYNTHCWAHSHLSMHIADGDVTKHVKKNRIYISRWRVSEGKHWQS